MQILWLILLPACLAAGVPLTRRDHSNAVPHRILVRLPGVHAEGPKACTLFQIKDKSGFPAGYSMVVDSVICPENTCIISTVHMEWDALGHYQRFELPLGEHLEKRVPSAARKAKEEPAALWKGVAFTEADYRKLDAILKDTHSLLEQHTLTDLVRPKKKGQVDGVTGATPATLREAVVEGASLTCYNLWHWANGEVADRAKELTHQQCGEAMLLSYLASDKPHYVLFALDHLRLHTLFGPSVVREVNTVMRSGDRERIDLGLAYLRNALADQNQFYENVGALINVSTSEGRSHLLDRLASEPALPAILFETLGAGLPHWNSYYETHLFLQLAERHGYASPFLIAQAGLVLDSPDFFIARRAHGFLNRLAALDAQTASRLQTFRDKAARDGRSL